MYVCMYVCMYVYIFFLVGTLAEREWGVSTLGMRRGSICPVVAESSSGLRLPTCGGARAGASLMGVASCAHVDNTPTDNLLNENIVGNGWLVS